MIIVGFYQGNLKATPHGGIWYHWQWMVVFYHLRRCSRKWHHCLNCDHSLSMKPNTTVWCHLKSDLMIYENIKGTTTTFVEKSSVLYSIIVSTNKWLSLSDDQSFSHPIYFSGIPPSIVGLVCVPQNVPYMCCLVYFTLGDHPSLTYTKTLNLLSLALFIKTSKNSQLAYTSTSLV